MASIFTKIIAGEIPCYKIAENEKFLSFLDINPIKRGHTLVIPKVETDEFFTLADNDLSEMMVFAKRISEGIKKTIPCNRIGMSVIGLEVPHAHIHLIPINSLYDMNFEQSRAQFTKEEFEATAVAISRNIQF
jgi:histidine triad (HIT) family protein